MSVLQIFGASMWDETFTLDLPGFPKLVWNTTRIEKDAFSGKFGPPQLGHFKSLHNPPGYDPWRHLDRDKVRTMVQGRHDIIVERPNWEDGGKTSFARRLIDVPLLQVELIKGERLHRVPVDGNHRMMARQVAGFPNFDFFVVPASLEEQYRVTMHLV